MTHKDQVQALTSVLPAGIAFDPGFEHTWMAKEIAEFVASKMSDVGYAVVYIGDER